MCDEKLPLPPQTGKYLLGVFGSMMNPPHNGHRTVIDAAYEQLGLQRIAVVPSGLPPHRRAPAVSARARLTMAVRAFADLDHVVVSDSEVERGEAGQLGYMVDTLEELSELPRQLGYKNLQVELTLIVGADQAVTLSSWHRFDRITQLARVAIAPRSDALDDAELELALSVLRGDWGIDPAIIRMQPVNISSTLVRSVAQSGDRGRIAELVPEAIVSDVWKLYGAKSR